jgi:hypothetical protein
MALYAVTAPLPEGAEQHGTIITAGTTTYQPALTKIWVGVTGNLTVTLVSGDSVTLTNVPVGMFTGLAITNVTTATATGLVGFWV